MKTVIALFLTLAMYQMAAAQYVYTIKADSVKLTNCDSTELIIENHTQAVPGFLYNTGKGRTIFKRALTKVNNSLYLVGSDSLQVPANAWVQGGNAFGTTGILGTKDNNHLDFYVNNGRQMRIDSLGHVLFDVAASTGPSYKVEIGGGLKVNGFQQFSGSADPITNIQIRPGYTNFYGTGLDASVIYFGGASIGTNNQDMGIIPKYSLVIGGASPQRYTTLVDYSKNPVFIVDGGGKAIINGGFYGIAYGAFSGSTDYGSQDFNINGPKGTGAGITADIVFSTATPAAAGTATLQAMTNRWWMKGTTGYLSNGSSPTSAIDVSGANGYSQFRMRTSYTPSSSTDANGNVGDFSWDGNYFYIKTPAGWKRSALTTF